MKSGGKSVAKPGKGWSWLVAAICLAFAPSARAQGVEDASRAFAAAQAAELAGDHERAADLYEAAYHLAPSREALRSAARSRFRAGQVAIAATHAAELLAQYPSDAHTQEFARELIARVEDDLGRLEITCRPACQLAIDGAASGLGEREIHEVWVEPGEHRLVASYAGGHRTESVAQVEAGAAATFELAPPARALHAPSSEAPAADGAGSDEPHTIPPPPSSSGISPWFAITGIVLTAAGAGLTVASGIDVEQHAETYRRMPTTEAYRDGLDRELRTNILIAATGATAAITAILAIFTDWSELDGSARDVAVHPLVTPSALGLLIEGGML